MERRDDWEATDVKPRWHRQETALERVSRQLFEHLYLDEMLARELAFDMAEMMVEQSEFNNREEKVA